MVVSIKMNVVICILPLLMHRCHALSLPSPSSPSSSSCNTRRDFLEGTVSSIAKTSAAAAASVATTAASFPTLSNAASTSSSTMSFALPPLGLGAWAWGDPVFWGYNSKNDGDLRQVFDYALDRNLAFFDTAELYGLGRSEELLGNFRRERCTTKEDDEKVIIASKFAPLPWRTKRGDVVKACEASVKRLGGKPIDLYQIHFPNAYSNAEYWDGVADAYDAGLVKSVGVSNYGIDALRACHDQLAKRGVKLASNQIQLSLLYRWPIENGLLQACKDLDVKVLSYSPLALGFLTGKYDRDNLPKGPRAKIGKELFSEGNNGSYEELLGMMKTVAENHGENVPISQVAINWAISKGTIPIPGARNIRQVEQNLGTLDWKLTPEEERQLDEVSAKVKGFVTPDKNPFPRVDKDTGLKMYDS